MRCAAAAAALAAGCLSVPSYSPDVAVSYTASGSGGAIAGPGFALQLAGGNGFHFPEALLIDGDNVLGREPDPGCLAEDEAGILIAPTPRISAHGPATVVTNRLAPALVGPAAVQVKLDWGTRFDCNSDRVPGGSSTFTVFPDGRIVRYDVLVDTSSASLSAGTCACDATAPEAAGFTLATYWTITRMGFDELRTYASIALPAPTVATGANESVSCFGAPNHQVAFAWREATGSVIRGGETLLAFGRDLQYRDSVLSAYMRDNSSALFIEHTGCDAALVRATEHVRPPQLTINGTPVAPSPRDGIYGGDAGDGPPGIALASDRVELTGSTRSSFAVWLRFRRAVEAVRATLEGRTGAWYVPQRVDDSSWIVWFSGSISAAQKIVVEPR